MQKSGTDVDSRKRQLSNVFESQITKGSSYQDILEGQSDILKGHRTF